ncbi:MAG: hypothetical protein JFAIHJKO_02075 [Pyrinomonadaceae bacterium]|nr:hypothetical protein [Pyrinomonadaceae bacterium]
MKARFGERPLPFRQHGIIRFFECRVFLVDLGGPPSFGKFTAACLFGKKDHVMIGICGHLLTDPVQFFDKFRASIHLADYSTPFAESSRIAGS